MSDHLPPHRRSQRRRTLAGVVNVYNQADGMLLGRLVNATTEGLMLVNEKPLSTDVLYQVELELPESIGQISRIELGMDSLWTSPSTPDADMYWTGCHIIDISDDMLSGLKTLIEKLGD